MQRTAVRTTSELILTATILSLAPAIHAQEIVPPSSLRLDIVATKDREAKSEFYNQRRFELMRRTWDTPVGKS
jgi:hypothetical protein